MAGTVAILGYGRFGSAFADLLLDSGLKVLAFDPNYAVPARLRASTISRLVRDAETVVTAVPVPATAEALALLAPHLTRRHLVVDVASVKAGPVRALAAALGRRVPWVATHPLFGPTSIARGERPLRVVVCPNPAHPGAAGRAQAFYERIGCEVIEEEAGVHDRIMARTHALAFFVAKGMLDAGAAKSVPFSPPSFQAMEQTIEAVRSDAGHLFYTIASLNPYSAAARERLLKALTRIHRRLAKTRPGPKVRPEAMRIPELDAAPPHLRKTRELIDELDEQLVAILARRAQLSRHAARSKADAGRPVQDAARERALLGLRRRWARDYELDGDDIARVFEAILRFSRAEQSRWLKSKDKNTMDR